MRESIFHGSHPAIGASLYLKARLLHELGTFKECGLLMGKSLQVRKVSLGQKHPSVAQSLWGLAELYRELGYPLHARDYHDNALVIRKEKFSEVDVQTHATWHRDIVVSLKVRD